MRSDLTTAFTLAKNAASRKPRQLMVFQFPVAGNVYVSDQEISLGGVTYLPLVESWGTLEDAAGAEDEFSSEVRQMAVTLWNGGSQPFSLYFLQEDPENVEVLLYQWFDGLADADKLLLDRFVVQDPIRFDERSRLLTLDLVSVNMRYTGRCGVTITTNLWPDALPEHVGRAIPLVFGSAGECPTLCLKTPPRATLKGSIAKNSTTIECNESLARFPASGILQIEDEKIQYSSRSDTIFYVSARGYGGTVKESHPDNCEVFRYITDHTYTVGQSPITSITDVKVAGHPAPAGTYSINLTGDYGNIIFNQKPYSYQYAATAVSQDLYPFVVQADNTAYQPHWAFDENKTSSSAMITEAYPTLSLRAAADIGPDPGLVVTAYLVVHHWETNRYFNDYAEVWIDGIGVVGRLARPSADDVSDLEAQVGIDHPHANVDPTVGLYDPTHPHLTQATVGKSMNGDPSNYSLWARAKSYSTVPVTSPFDHVKYIYFNNLENNSVDSTFSIQLDAVATGGGGSGHITFIEITTSAGRYMLLDKFPWMSGLSYTSSSYNRTITLSAGTWNNATSFWVKIRTVLYVVCSAVNSEEKLEVFYSLPLLQYSAKVGTVNPGLTNAATQKTASGYVISNNNDTRSIEFLTQNTPSRTIIDRFDISDFISPSWSWFANRKIQIRYKNVHSESVKILIPWVTFEVEYRKREKVYSDEVTATVTGDTGNRPDKVIRTLLAKGGLPDAMIDWPTHNAANAWYAANSYGIDGVIDGDLSVQEAIKKVCRQSRSRLFWSAGKAKLAIRRTSSEQAVVKELGPANYQLRSISATRQSVQDLVNYIDLFYKIDRLDGDLQYQSAVIRQDQQSIAAHGRRERPDDFLFDLVRSDAMAASLAEYYVAVGAWPATFYEFNAYLEQLELEKEDVIALTSGGFHKLRGMPVILRSVNRVFGSGKAKTINHLRLVGKCLHYILLEHTIDDTVLIFDSLDVNIGKSGDLSENVLCSDELSVASGAGLADEQLVEDELEIVWHMAPLLEDAVALEDSVGMAWDCKLEDTVNILDQLDAKFAVGFGSGQFGLVPFGSVLDWYQSAIDEAYISDEYHAHMGIGLPDDTVLLGDVLAASTGFGSPGTIADGFGNIPFGQ